MALGMPAGCSLPLHSSGTAATWARSERVPPLEPGKAYYVRISSWISSRLSASHLPCCVCATGLVQAQPPAGYAGYGYGGVTAQAGYTPSTSSGRSERIIVTGCKHETVGDIVRGEFNLHSDNHGKPVYKKNGQVNGMDIMLYFWDDRDGPDFCGWWFGPKVGGDQVWAYHPEKAPTPPLSGWKVPYDGPVDNTFILQPASGYAKSQTAAAQYQPVHPGVPQPMYSYGPPAYGLPPAYGYGVPGAYDAQASQKEDRKRDEDSNRRDNKKKKEEDAKQRKKNAEEDRKNAAKRKEEEAAKKKENEQKQKEEAAKQKKDLEEKRRQEQRSTLAIRRVIQKVRLASPETFAEVQKELQEILAVELPNTGSQKERIKEESEKGLEQATKRLGSIKEQRQKEMDKKEAEEKKRLEQQVKTDELLKELSDLVELAEASVERLKGLSAPLSDKIEDSVKEVEACALAVEEAGTDAKGATKACTDFILVKGNDIKDPTPSPLAPGIQAPGTSETKQVLGKLLQRINECGKTADALIQAARGAKEQAVRCAAARQKTKEMEAVFAKFDRDKDQVLSQMEVVAYARNVMSVNVDKVLLEKIWRCTVDEDEKGISPDKMYLLNSALGVAREMQRNERRRTARIAKERVLAGLRERLRSKVREVEKVYSDFDREMQAAEDAVRPLAAKAKKSSVSEMDRDASHCDDLLKASSKAADKVRQRIKTIPLGFDKKYEEDMKEFFRSEAKLLELQMGRADLRLQRAANLSRRHREQAWRKEAQEVEMVRAFAMKVIRHYARVNTLSNEDLFRHLDADGDGGIDEEEFVSFFSTVDKDIKEEEFEPEDAQNEQVEMEANPLEEMLVDTLEEPLPSDADEETVIRQQSLAAIMLQATPKPKPKPKKVVKAELSPEELKSLFGSVLDPDAVKISPEAFFRLVKVYYKVVKETPMTEKLEVNGSQTVHQLKVGEIVEMLEGPEKEVSMKVFRARGKVIGEDKEGWVTVAGNQGTIFLQEGGHLWKVLRQTELFESFEDVPPKAGVRKLKEAEVVEVLSWPQKHEESGLTRLKVKAKLDGAIGWISQSKDGVSFVDPL
ncbi:unnamed protein product [Effrenium voratum]|nr:unnamed protein product [Effrenium voratum]